jgi:hypothetical protein
MSYSPRMQRQRLAHVLEQAYLDKLDGKIREDFWEAQSNVFPFI